MVDSLRPLSDLHDLGTERPAQGGAQALAQAAPGG